MVGQIGPLVQVGRKNLALALHAFGGLVGGATLGVLLGFVAVLAATVLPGVPDPAFAVAVPALLAYAGLTDLGLLRLTYFTWQRQTPGSWPCALGHYPAMFAWGFDLGLGVSTRFPYQGVIVVPIAAVLTGSMGAAIALTAAYGLARALAVVIAITAARGEFSATCDAIQNRSGVLRRVVGATALVTALVIVLV